MDFADSTCPIGTNLDFGGIAIDSTGCRPTQPMFLQESMELLEFVPDVLSLNNSPLFR